MGGWRHLFPLPTPRPEQERALDMATEMVDAGERFVIAELGTGVGKSAVGVCLANYIREKGGLPNGPGNVEYDQGAYVLTSQKTLQDQYVRDFSKNVSDLRSSANFDCANGPGENCGQTMRYIRHTKKGEGPNSCDGCPYKKAKDRFMAAPVSVTNYSYFLSETVYAGELKPRELLILDEAHNVEGEMRRWATFQVDEESAMGYGCEFPWGAGKSQALGWLIDEYRPAVVARMLKVTALVESAQDRGVKKGLSDLVEELDFLDRHVCTLNRLLGESPSGQSASDKNYLMDWEQDKNGRRELRVQPLDAGPLANDLLYPLGAHVLLMSATVLDRRTFMAAAGIGKAGHIREPSPFPPENYGITYRPVGRMSRAHIETTLPKVVKAVRRILADHPDEKGIIHCATYDVAKAIATIKDRRLLVQESAKDREEILARHTSDPAPTVIVSPSMMEGLDLEGDLGRLQVICKIPFPYMGDPVVSAKMKADRGWYAWVTARAVIQATGRCVRNRDDWTKTYILDESFGPFMTEWMEMFPEYFLSMSIEE